MSKHLKLISVQLLLLLFIVNAAPVFGQLQQAYERGMEELHRGNVNQALDIWHASYEQSAQIDSRIGFEYMVTVTENQKRSYYEPATTLYYRALTDGTGMQSRVAVRKEIERLKPIIGDGIYRQWMNWWNDEDPNLAIDMKGFWVQNDPTPATITNERLIEHWQRIAAAKEQFTKNSNTVYGTDERAFIYVRYGEPNRVKNGILTLQSFNVKNWLEQQLAPQDQNRNRRSAENDDAPGDHDIMNRLQNAIYDFHRYPEYEIWFYDQIINPQNNPVIFLFGTDVRNEEFSLQTSLEDFIPEQAFYADNRNEDESLEFTRAGITPALILQLLYYEQLAQVDEFFERRLNELQSKILEQGIQAFQGMDLAFQNESKEIINKQVTQAPVQKSTYADLIPKIPLDIYQYRFLSDSLDPEILTYIESSAQEAFLIDYNRNQGRNLLFPADIEHGYHVLDKFPYYRLTHSMQAYDKAWEVSLNVSDQPPLYITRPGESQMSMSVFRQPHTGKTFQSVSVELMNYDPDSESIYQTPFPASLRGWNKRQYRQPQPLSSNRDSLEVSDLVLGYHHSENTEPFDFKVANNQLIPFGETLLLHFEVYNLSMRDSGFSHFEMTYRILPVDEHGNILTDQSEFILTLNFTNEESFVTEDLEIETTQLNAGLYELVVSILDTESDQTKERRIRFEVVD